MKNSIGVLSATLASVLALSFTGAAFAIDCDDLPRGVGESSTLELVTNNVSTPLDVTAPAGDTDRLFIVERRGTIRIFDLNTNSLLSTPFLDIASRVTEGGDLGLLSMAFLPTTRTTVASSFTTATTRTTRLSANSRSAMTTRTSLILVIQWNASCSGSRRR